MFHGANLRKSIRDVGAVLLLSAAAIAVHGYHFGAEDGASYIPAVKHALDPALYPHDADFATALSHFGMFVPMVAASVRVTRMSLEWAALAWHVLSIFVLLLACRKLARMCFSDVAAQWGATIAVWGALLLPVAGTGIAITERYLHPRNLAIGAVVFGIAAALERNPISVAWIVAAVAIHPTIGLCGAFHAAVQWRRPHRKTAATHGAVTMTAALPLILAWILPRPNPAWRALIESRAYLFPLRWHWYEWVGVIAPILLLQLCARVARRDGDCVAAHLAGRAAIAGALGTAGALVITGIPAFLPLVAAEPMRVLQIVYLFFVLIGGGLIGRHLLRKNRIRWTAFILLVAGAFYAADKLEYPASAHIEWPGAASNSAWIEAFNWVRENTPRGAYFAIDPLYTQQAGEDVHGFRAFAERSVTADAVKDRSVAQVDSNLAAAWQQQTSATRDWQRFDPEDFARLGKLFQVDWVLLDRSSSAVARMNCPFINTRIAVCKLPTFVGNR